MFQTEKSYFTTKILIDPAAHQYLSDRRAADFPGGGVHWWANKGLPRFCSSSVTVVGFDLVVSQTKYRLVVIA